MDSVTEATPSPARPRAASAGKPARRLSLEHPTRTALATVASLLAARLVRLPEPYWAPITTIVITQSLLGAALEVSRHRFVGTVFGAIVGGLAAGALGQHDHPALRILMFALGIFLLGVLFQMMHSDRTAYRFGGVTLAIVLLLPRADSAWLVAFHRFAAVTIGIATALLFAVLWPEKPCFRGE